jgi:hypothetical protein
MPLRAAAAPTLEAEALNSAVVRKETDRELTDQKIDCGVVPRALHAEVSAAIEA